MITEWAVRPSRPRDFVAKVYLRDAALALALAFAPQVLWMVLPSLAGVGVLEGLPYILYVWLCVWRPNRGVSEHQAGFELTRWALASGLWTRSSLARALVRDLLWRSLYHVPVMWIFMDTPRLPVVDIRFAWVPLLPMTPSLFLGIFSFQVLVRASITVWSHLGTATFLPARLRDMYTNAYPDIRSHCSVWSSLLLLVAVVSAALVLVEWIGNPGALAPLALAVAWIAWVMVRTSETTPHGPLPPFLRGWSGSRTTLPSHGYSPLAGLLFVGSKWWVRALLPVIAASAVCALLIRRLRHPWEDTLSRELPLGLVVTAVGLFAAGAPGWYGPFRWSSRGPRAELLESAGISRATLAGTELAAGLLFAIATVSPAALFARRIFDETALLYLLSLLFALLLLRCDHRPLIAKGTLSPHRLAYWLLSLHVGCAIAFIVLGIPGLWRIFWRLPYGPIAVVMVAVAGIIWFDVVKE